MDQEFVNKIFGTLPFPMKSCYILTMTKPFKKVLCASEDAGYILDLQAEIDAQNDYEMDEQIYTTRTEMIPLTK